MRRRNRGKLNPELMALIVDILPTVGSLRDICAITGLGLDVVREATAPFLAIMKLTGTHPKCGCGKDRFHPYGCSENRAKGARGDCDPGHSVAQTAIYRARRQTIIAEILKGDTFADIERRLGLPAKTARKYQRFMTAEQIAQRKRMEGCRRTSLRRDGAHVRPFKDPLYARIASAVPRWVTDATRDDIISEMCLAVSDGTLAPDAIEANAKRFATAAIRLWESTYGPRSLDERLREDGTMTFLQSLPDPDALAAFDRITIGNPYMEDCYAG